MLILERRSCSVTVYILEPLEETPRGPYCSSAIMLAHTPSFGSLLIFAIDFTSSAFHVTGAFYSPVPVLHSQSIHIRHRSLYVHVMLAFSALSARYPSDTQPLYSHIVYSNSQHHLHSNLL